MSQRLVSLKILFQDNIIEKVEGTAIDLLAGKRIAYQASIHDKCTRCKMIFGISVVYMVFLSLINIFHLERRKQYCLYMKYTIVLKIHTACMLVI